MTAGSEGLFAEVRFRVPESARRKSNNDQEWSFYDHVNGQPIVLDCQAFVMVCSFT